MSEIINVLYVDDEKNNIESFKANFRKDFNVFCAISASQARQIIEENIIHVIISDHRMPGTTGTMLLSEAQENHPDIIRILITGYSDIRTLIEAVNIGRIYKYVEKPFEYQILKENIIEAYEVYHLK